MTPIRVLIADDHRLFRLGLRQACESASDFEVVGEAENGQEAVELAHRCRPDVILMDIQMPLLDGVEATRRIVENDASVRVIMLTIYRQDRYVFEAIKVGARDYLLKDIDEGELLEAIRAVHRSEALINPGLATKVLDEFRRLSQVAVEASDVESTIYAFVQTPAGDFRADEQVAREGDEWQYDIRPEEIGRYTVWINAGDRAGNAATAGPHEVEVISAVAPRVWLPLVMKEW